MEKVKILGVDPSLRKTGLAIVEWHSDTHQFHVSNCQVLLNPEKYTGTAAILNMLDLIDKASYHENYQSVDAILIESPAVMFNKAWAGGTISSIAHIAGGAAALLGLDKSHLFRPNEWNKTRKKEVTHNKTVAVLGTPEKWEYLVLVKEKHLEHVLDAASLALWWLQQNYDTEVE